VNTRDDSRSAGGHSAAVDKAKVILSLDLISGVDGPASATTQYASAPRRFGKKT